MVMEGVAEPALLFIQAQDAHHLQLKPSQVRQALEADALVYTHPQLETFVPELQEASGNKLKAIRLGDSPGYDWLNPERAVVMLYFIARELAVIDQPNAARYRANAQKYQLAIDKHAGKWMQRLNIETDERQFIAADHPAFDAFTQHFVLPPILILEDAGGNISLKQLKVLEGKKLACIFATHGSNAIIHRLSEASGARVIADFHPLGTGYTAGIPLYFELMDKAVREFRECLS